MFSFISCYLLHSDFGVWIGYDLVRAIEESMYIDPLMFRNGIHKIPFSPEESFDQFK